MNGLWQSFWHLSFKAEFLWFFSFDKRFWQLQDIKNSIWKVEIVSIKLNTTGLGLICENTMHYDLRIVGLES